MKIRVRLWGGLADAAGSHEEVLDLDDGAKAGDALAVITSRSPGLARYRTVTRVAVNAEIVDAQTPLADGDEVSLLPPVAGGGPGAGGGDADLIAIRSGAVDVSEAIAAVTTPASGGIGVFVGTVRDRNEGKDVTQIDYTSYEEMALREMRAGVEAARDRWPIHRAAVLHSVGRLAVGEPSVVVAVSATHRAEALEACRFLIDHVKDNAPIWKQEFGPDGSRWVNLPAEP